MGNSITKLLRGCDPKITDHALVIWRDHLPHHIHSFYKCTPSISSSLLSIPFLFDPTSRPLCCGASPGLSGYRIRKNSSSAELFVLSWSLLEHQNMSCGKFRRPLPLIISGTQRRKRWCHLTGLWHLAHESQQSTRATCSADPRTHEIQTERSMTNLSAFKAQVALPPPLPPI